MALSLFGADGDTIQRGIIADNTATGMYLADLAMSAQEEEVTVENHIGEVVGLSLGNQSAEITASGVLLAKGNQTQVLGDAMGTLLNSATMLLDTTVTEFYITSINTTRANKQYETGSFTARGWTGLTDTVTTEQS